MPPKGGRSIGETGCKGCAIAAQALEEAKKAREELVEMKMKLEQQSKYTKHLAENVSKAGYKIIELRQDVNELKELDLEDVRDSVEELKELELEDVKDSVEELKEMELEDVKDSVEELGELGLRGVKWDVERVKLGLGRAHIGLRGVKDSVKKAKIVKKDLEETRQLVDAIYTITAYKIGRDFFPEAEFKVFTEVLSKAQKEAAKWYAEFQNKRGNHGRMGIDVEQAEAIVEEPETTSKPESKSELKLEENDKENVDPTETDVNIRSKKALALREKPVLAEISNPGPSKGSRQTRKRGAEVSGQEGRTVEDGPGLRKRARKVV